jgi:DHA1 family tetracycline resistance protein-like MFS transporter
MSSLVVIFAIVLVDLLGFSIVMPLLPRFAKEYGFNSAQIGMLLAAYPLCQLVAGPILGRLSDRYGRRPLLVASQAGTAISFLILGLSRNFTVMLLARLLDGASGGNILIAQAYIADVTRPEHRARNLGLIGAAFGIGFVLGPFMGGLLVSAPVAPDWQLRLPFLVAAAFSTVAWLLVLTRLPESLPAEPEEARQHTRVVSRSGLANTLSNPAIARLVATSALVVLGFAALEGTFSLFLRERMHWGPRAAAYAFAFLGLVSALVQGGLIRRLVPRFGEEKLVVVGVSALAVGLAAIALAPNAPALVLAMMLVGLGQGLASPSLQGLISRKTPAREQGAVFGTLTSAQTLARMLNYMIGNVLLGKAGPAAPFWEGSAIAWLALASAVFATRIQRPASGDNRITAEAGAHAKGSQE